MISHAEIVRRSRRHNYEENIWVHPFSGRIASRFTWVFINLGLQANHVTALSFVAGTISAVFLLFDSLLFAVVAFVFFRLHVILDVSDGEVARYREQVSRFGVFWDQLMHAFVLPLLIGCIAIGRLITGASIGILAFGIAGMVGKSTDLSVKNSYYRVLYLSGQKIEDKEPFTTLPNQSNRFKTCLGILFHFISIDGLLWFYALSYLIEFSWLGFTTRDWVFATYSILFNLIAVIRMTSTYRRDRLPMRRDYRT
jgi:phosphatidylglycerophosphate synthase